MLGWCLGGVQLPINLTQSLHMRVWICWKLGHKSLLENPVWFLYLLFACFLREESKANREMMQKSFIDI